MSAVAGSKWSAVGRLLLCARLSLTSFAVGFTWTTEAGLNFYVLQDRLLFYVLQHRLLFLFWVEVVTAAAVTIIPYLKEQQVGQPKLARTMSRARCHTTLLFCRILNSHSRNFYAHFTNTTALQGAAMAGVHGLSVLPFRQHLPPPFTRQAERQQYIVLGQAQALPSRLRRRAHPGLLAANICLFPPLLHGSRCGHIPR